MENYYIDTTDFDEYKDQVLLYGDESILKWIDEVSNKYTLYSTVQPNIIYKPYFFSK